MSALAWMLMIAIGLVVTIAANWLFSFGLQRLPTGVTAAYAYLMPVAAAGWRGCSSASRSRWPSRCAVS